MMGNWLDRRRLRIAGSLLPVVLWTLGCECGSKGRKSRTIAPNPAVDPKPADPPNPPAPGPNPNVGEAVPPVTPDSVVQVDTGDKGGIRHLVIQTSDKTEFGRQLSEYMLVIRAKDASCVRIKVRPTSSMQDSVTDEVARSEGSNPGPCQEADRGGEKAAAPTPPAPPAPPAAPAPAALRLATTPSAPSNHREIPWERLELIDPTVPRLPGANAHLEVSQGFGLTAASNALCSARLFRMPSNVDGEDAGFEKVATKTGRLVAVGEKVRIWLDDEYSDVCLTASDLDRWPAVRFGPLEQMGVLTRSANWVDRLWLAQVSLLRKEMDKIATQMSSTFGDYSDVDKSGYVEIFVSPDVNRRYFSRLYTSWVDSFRANLILRPQDLAYYNAETNPTSNEGEVLYLWSPDPAGIYGGYAFPSANSLTSNYAKGFLSAQLMGLIYSNNKILKPKSKDLSDLWLMESLALLASAYYGGNDYSSYYLSHYLTSRSHYIPLTKPLNKEFFSEKFLGFAQEEQTGMRTMFGWYLHSRLCGATSVDPCSPLAKLIASAKRGTESVEELTGVSYDEILRNFGLSVAVGLADRPSEVIKLWEGKGADYPPVPRALPDVTEVWRSNPPLTEEEDNLGQLRATADAERIDRTAAGPFPSRKMMMTQVLSADYDLEYKLDADSISVILVTGLVNQTTDIAAFLGPALNVVIVPVGDRDPAVRGIHFEKLSELAPGDLRGKNLTNSMQSFSTYSGAPAYYNPDLALGSPSQLTVTKARDLWALGSVTNQKVNIEGSWTPVSDSDSYSVEFRPCLNVQGDPTCASRTHQAMVQVILRDAAKELAPMLLVTSTDRRIFRGHSLLGLLSDVDSTVTAPQPGQVQAICQADHLDNNSDGVKRVLSVASFDGTARTITTLLDHNLAVGDDVYFTVDNGDMPPGLAPWDLYQVTATPTTKSFGVVLKAAPTVTVDFASTATGMVDVHKYQTPVRCANGSVAGASVFDDRGTRLNPPRYNHNYHNYLMLGPLGYPYTTRGTLTWDNPPECPGPRCYLGAESDRQHLNFALTKDVKPTQYDYYPVTLGYDDAPPFEPLDEDVVENLAYVKGVIDSPTCADPQAPANQTFVDVCSGLPGVNPDLCANVCAKNNNHLPLENAIIAQMRFKGAFGICRPGATCSALGKLMSPGFPPDPANASRHTKTWLSPSRFLRYESPAAADRLVTRFVPTQPEKESSYCLGFDDGVAATEPSTLLTPCAIKSDTKLRLTDLREQLNVASGRLSYGCLDSVIGTDFDVCIDPISQDMELSPNDEYVSLILRSSLPTDRVRSRLMPITMRVGELVAKPERLQTVLFDVPGSGAIVNVIIGGRKLSQGKYLMRARLMDR